MEGLPEGAAATDCAMPGRRRFLQLFGAVAAAEAMGCGAVIYPERIGQPRGEMDWEIVALDALGLILFFVPGVIAFAVDFATGAIYLPPRGYSGMEPMPAGTEEWRTVNVPPEDLDRSGITAAVTRETGTPVDLTSPDVQTRPLDGLQSFNSETAELASQWEAQ